MIRPTKRNNHIKKLAFSNLLSIVFSFQTHSKGYRQLPCSTSTSTTPTTTTSTHASKRNNNIGDTFSFLIGKAPSKLDVPFDLLQGTNIDPEKDNVKLDCVYKASKDGWSAIDFHKCVDGKGSAIVCALSKSGKRFGGFNPLGWLSTDDYGNTNSAWLWFVNNQNKNKRVPILAGGNTAIYDYATGGPTFGSADLMIGPPKAAVMGGFAGPDVENISINAGDLRKCKSTLGNCYDFVDGWPMRGEGNLIEVEVYCNVNIPSMTTSKGFWPF